MSKLKIAEVPLGLAIGGICGILQSTSIIFRDAALSGTLDNLLISVVPSLVLGTAIESVRNEYFRSQRLRQTVDVIALTSADLLASYCLVYGAVRYINQFLS